MGASEGNRGGITDDAEQQHYNIGLRPAGRHSQEPTKRHTKEGGHKRKGVETRAVTPAVAWR